MASGAVRSGISEVLEEKCVDLESPRIECMKKIGRELLCKATKNDQLMKVFDEFCVSLYTKLERVCVSCKRLKSHSAMRARLWSAFHQAAVSELPSMWDTIFSSLDTPCKDQLMSQSTNEKLILRKYFSERTETAEQLKMN